MKGLELAGFGASDAEFNDVSGLGLGVEGLEFGAQGNYRRIPEITGLELSGTMA